MSLPELAQEIILLKKQIAALRDEHATTCNTARHNAIPGEENVLRNKLYDATHDFRKALEEATGVDAYRINDLIHDYGYVLGIELPKCMKQHFPDPVKLDGSQDG